MPVDPGNLLLIADARGRPLLGAPGCARSPKENGFDWVLMRLLAGLEVPREAITGMGVGGLLMEIVTRPQPRAEPPAVAPRRIAAVVLAAGRSTRMGGPNKLLAEIARRPLVRIAAEEALASRAKPVIVVTGHQREQVEAALDGLAGAARAQSGFRRRPRHLGQGRHRGGAGGCRRRDRLPRRHAAGRRRPDRSPDRRLRSGPGRAGGDADVRGQARQSGAVVAPVLSRSHGDRRRRRRALPDRPLQRGAWSRCRSRARPRWSTSTRRRRLSACRAEIERAFAMKTPGASRVNH